MAKLKHANIIIKTSYSVCKEITIQIGFKDKNNERGRNQYITGKISPYTCATLTVLPLHKRRVLINFE